MNKTHFFVKFIFEIITTRRKMHFNYMNNNARSVLILHGWQIQQVEQYEWFRPHSYTQDSTHPEDATHSSPSSGKDRLFLEYRHVVLQEHRLITPVKGCLFPIFNKWALLIYERNKVGPPFTGPIKTRPMKSQQVYRVGSGQIWPNHSDSLLPYNWPSIITTLIMLLILLQRKEKSLIIFSMHF